MYISPLIVLVPPGPAAAVLLATLLDRIGGTSTCWMPLRACSCALIRAAAAAIERRSVTRCRASTCRVPWTSSIAYQQPRRDRLAGILSRRASRGAVGEGYGRGRDGNQTGAPAESESGGRSGIVEVPARSGRSGSALRRVARRRPLCSDLCDENRLPREVSIKNIARVWLRWEYAMAWLGRWHSRRRG